MNNLIELLERQELVWQGSAKQQTGQYYATGYSELDQQLNGGLPIGVTEINSMLGIGELRLILPLLRSNMKQQLVVFINPPGINSAQMLLEQGFELDKIILLQPSTTAEALWAAEQCLRSGTCYAVLMWHDGALKVHHIKRLQVACEATSSLQFLFRTKKTDTLALPLDVSLSVTPHKQGLTVRINKRKRGWPSENFLLNMCKAWPHLTLQQAPSNIVHFPVEKVG